MGHFCGIFSERGQRNRGVGGWMGQGMGCWEWGWGGGGGGLSVVFTGTLSILYLAISAGKLKTVSCFAAINAFTLPELLCSLGQQTESLQSGSCLRAR